MKIDNNEVFLFLNGKLDSFLDEGIKDKKFRWYRGNLRFQKFKFFLFLIKKFSGKVVFFEGVDGFFLDILGKGWIIRIRF